MTLDKLSALSTLALEMHRACRETPVNEYQSWALDRLKTHIPFDSALWASGAFNKVTSRWTYDTSLSWVLPTFCVPV